MKQILTIIASFLMLSCLSGCLGNGEWEKYETWRLENNKWYESMVNLHDSDGNPYFKRLSPSWNQSSGVLIHYFNDRSLTAGNLSPLMTSTVDVKYLGRLYNDQAFDSSYLNTADYGDSIYRTQPYQNIEGWQIALNDMHVGDSAEVIIPYTQAYGSSGTTMIPPYTALKFYIKLVGIPAYEIAPEMIGD